MNWVSATSRAGRASAGVSIRARGVRLEGELIVPESPRGIVLFAHGSGSSRQSPRNQSVARTLREHGFGTLLMDLLTEEEESSEHATFGMRFDVDLLARRLLDATDWIAQQESTRSLSLGYFGASTGAAAALTAAAGRPAQVHALVSRGGRPDLAKGALSAVKAPTLLIVGAEDPIVLELNREAFELLRVEKRLEVIPRATHLFEEPGALDSVAEIAAEWFEGHLTTSASLPERRRKQPRGRPSFR